MVKTRNPVQPITWVLTVFASLAAMAAAPTTIPAEKYQHFAMVHQGDASAGRALFLNEQKLACTKCHTIDGSASKAGPDLAAIGDKYGRDALIQAILSPSASIAVGYSSTIVKIKSGDVYEGIIKRSGGGTISLMGADGKLVEVKVADIERQRTTDLSLMPEGLQNALTLQQFADLISYLSSLKAPRMAAAVERGMPADIAELRTPVKLEPFILEKDRFQHPSWFGPVPGVAGAFAAVEHEAGKIWVIRKNADQESKSLFLDTGHFQAGTHGLVGMVFHPDYAGNRRYFIVKHSQNGGHFFSRLMEGEAASDLQSDSGRPLRLVMQFDSSTNANHAGDLQFGSDGYLYIGVGDSGPGGDPEGHSQDLSILLGKILRIDVDHPVAGKLYSVPADNPFVGRPGVRPEIWAYGLREPWRFSFDPVTGDLWAGDVGQDLYEEVDVIRRGGNYGWNIYEGFERFSNRYRREGERYVPPVFAYTRKYGVCVTGGYVYRADPKSSFYGAYIFGDYQTRRVFAIKAKDGVLEKVRLIGRAPEMFASFGRDDAGELYVVGYGGMIYRLDLRTARFE